MRPSRKRSEPDSAISAAKTLRSDAGLQQFLLSFLRIVDDLEKIVDVILCFVLVPLGQFPRDKMRLQGLPTFIEQSDCGIKLDIVASCGLHLEFGNRVVTSPIQKVSVIRFGERDRSSAAQINVVLSWFEELKRRVPTGNN